MHPQFDSYEWKWNMYHPQLHDEPQRDKIMMFNCIKHGLTYNTFCLKCRDEEAKRQPKMAREEAEKLVSKLSYNIGTGNIFDGKGLPPEKQFINVLEALGLLKFDEVEQTKPKTESIDWIDRAEFYLANGVGPTSEIINGLVRELEKRPKIGDTVTIVNPHFNTDEYMVRGKLVSVG